MLEMFERFTTGCARFTGRPGMLIICMMLSLAGIAAYFVDDEHFIAGTSLAINIVTLMILPILQSTQNRDGAALQAKLDELIKSNNDARDEVVGLEKKSEEEIEAVRADVSGNDGCD